MNLGLVVHICNPTAWEAESSLELVILLHTFTLTHLHACVSFSGRCACKCIPSSSTQTLNVSVDTAIIFQKMSPAYHFSVDTQESVSLHAAY